MLMQPYSYQGMFLHIRDVVMCSQIMKQRERNNYDGTGVIA